ncbi:MAG: hypothetical protein HY876_00575 [Coriobacteriales bacterium]|nr:hypothetical protein [Coriobacteriales bacterium]
MGAEGTVRTIAGYERTSAILWLVLGVVQCVTVVGAIAGVWNIFAALSRFRLSRAIVARDPGVPGAFEPIGGLIAIGLVNLVFGGAVGVLFVILDIYVREQVLENRHLFAGGAGASAA